MTRFLLGVTLLLGGAAFCCCTLKLIAQDKAPPVAPAKLPLTRVVLTNAGIGYFHREGTLDGTASVLLRVEEDEINDLILTLLATDASGTSRQITYDNRAPAEVALKSFRIDLTENPGIGSLLQQVRGERVEISTDNPTMATVTGSIISVQKPQVGVIAKPGEDAKATIVLPRAEEIEQVNLYTDEGLVSVPMAKIRKVKFVKAELQAEFRQALEALAAARGDGKKAVSVTFHGQGPRPVSLGYVTESPLWKPTYRLTMPPAGQFGNLGNQFGIAGGPAPNTARLQGLAAVENTTDEDWKNVQMKLVSSRPITFRMDLYDPLFIPRPTVEMDLYASLRPPVYQGPGIFGGATFAGGLGGMPMGNTAQGMGVLGGNGVAANLGAGGGVAGIGGGQLGMFGTAPATSARAQMRNRLTFEELKARQQDRNTEHTADPISAASVNLGESFEYTLAEPVTLNRSQSALLPILNEAVGIKRLSIYNPAIQAAYPLKGLHVHNTTKLYLAQGPVTVYENDVAVGQALLPDVKPGETRLLSFAIDLDVAMTKERGEDVRTPVAMTIANGVLKRTTRVRVTNRYRAANRSADARTLWITHPIEAGWKLISPAKPVETTASLYRFELPLAANALAALAVIEEQDEMIDKPLAALTTKMIDDELASETTPAVVKAALTKIKTLEAARLATANASIAESVAMTEIIEEQSRQRANLEALPRESDAFKRLVKKFDDQETALDLHRMRMKVLDAKKLEQQQELTAYLKELKVD